MTNGTNEPQFVTTAIPFVALESSAVLIDGVDATLLNFAKRVAALHSSLFAEPLIITSGRDGIHVAGSAHLKGKALDIRSRDLNETEQLLFGIILAYFAPSFGVGVFDERGSTVAPHWHLEVGMFVS